MSSEKVSQPLGITGNISPLLKYSEIIKQDLEWKRRRLGLGYEDINQVSNTEEIISCDKELEAPWFSTSKWKIMRWGEKKRLDVEPMAKKKATSWRANFIYALKMIWHVYWVKNTWTAKHGVMYFCCPMWGKEKKNKIKGRKKS